MTTEVIIRNKSGIVLAADSAVTVNSGYSQKVFNNANKLFMLSKHHPIGLLVYQSASINNIPIEIIVKEFREKLGSISYSTLDKYYARFFEFLQAFIQRHSTQGQQNDDYFNFFIMFLNTFSEQYLERSKATAFDSSLFPKIFTINSENYFYKITPEERLIIESNAMFDEALKTRVQDARADYNIDTIFECFEGFINNVAGNNYTGVAICGYGKDDIYPKICTCMTYGCIGTQFIKTNEDISDKGDGLATIIPLAQSDMVETFVQGLSRELYTKLEAIFSNNTQIVINEICSAFNDIISDEIVIQINNNIQAQLDKTRQNFHNIINTSHVGPLLETISSLSREEMAELAENLINIQILKYRVSPNLETVGGPVDVAIISKHDGFIWKKRKLYFPQELNFQFFEKYFK